VSSRSTETKQEMMKRREGKEEENNKNGED
jgi:hypothetical protein